MAGKFPLRPYQQQVKDAVLDSWRRGVRNTLAVMPTGAGKTVLFSDILSDDPGASCAIAHRQELVTQMSQALARDGVRHRIIGPDSVVRQAVANHVAELGRSYYSKHAACAVAGVDTLKRRKDLGDWARRVSLWVTDEAHHLLRGNKWGDAVAMFPNARGLGVTATPCRGDGKGLGSHADGVFGEMVEGPAMRWLINSGFLTDYRIFCPPSDLDMGNAAPGSTGDWSPNQLKAAAQKSHIVGDVVAHYLRIAPGKLGVTFATDVATATDIADRFNAAGAPAAIVSAETPDPERQRLLRKFRNRELLQLVNVDLFGEGFDLPAIEVVSMARPTQSYSLYVQQFGRALRVMLDAPYPGDWGAATDADRLLAIAVSSKPRAIIIDHVGNVVRHGLPDAPRAWTLDARERKTSSSPADAVPLRVCLNPLCLGAYERVLLACPHCGQVPAPTGRSSPEQVDGDLVELDAAALDQLRGAVARVDLPAAEYMAELRARHVPAIGQQAHTKRHVQRQQAQAELRHYMSWWGGWQTALGRPDREAQRRFFYAFGVDVLTAQALGTDEARALAGRVRDALQREGITCG